MKEDDDSNWTAVYETVSGSDADLVKTTLETAGFKVSILGSTTLAASPTILGMSNPLTVAVPTEDADDARDYLKRSTTFEPSNGPALPSQDEPSPEQAVEAAAQEILDLRSQHETAACKYCGIATLDVGEGDLDSRRVALLRAVGLGVNSATFSEFKAGERICTECAGHEVDLRCLRSRT